MHGRKGWLLVVAGCLAAVAMAQTDMRSPEYAERLAVHHAECAGLHRGLRQRFSQLQASTRDGLSVAAAALDTHSRQEGYYLALAEPVLGKAEAERVAQVAADRTLEATRTSMASIPPFCDFVAFLNQVELD